MAFRFLFDSEQRNGIAGLIILIIIGLLLTYKTKNQTAQLTRDHESRKKEKKVQHFIDSLKKAETAKRRQWEIYPFNPNFITDYKGYNLGMSTEDIDRLHRYREKGKWINTTEGFQRVTRVSDSLMTIITPFFKFPEWVREEQKKENPVVKPLVRVSSAEKTDLNTATVEDLEKINGIGKVLSHRIIRHRSQLHGFRGNRQLRDIYGLKYKVRNRILEKFTVKTGDKEKLDLNRATVAELSDIYYLDYELARQIIDYRLTHEGITSFEELTKIEGFPVNRMEQLKLYLEIEVPENLEK